MKNKTLIPALFFAIIFICPLSAQWTKTKGLPGGMFEHFAQIADTTFAQHFAGIYFSTDSGFSWQNLLTYQFYWSGRLSTDGQNLLVRQYSSDPSVRLMRSNDAGQNWIPIAAPDSLSISYEIVIGQWVVIGTPDGAFRTGDNGATWELVHNYLGNLYLDGQRIYGRDADSVLVSSDFGQSWQGLASVSNVSDIFAKDSLIMVFQYQNKNRLSVSKDYGLSWEILYPILPSGIRFNQMYNSIEHNDEIYGIWGRRILKTSDFGETWMETTPPNLDVVYNGISVGEGLLMGGGANGIFRSNDGGDSWEAVNEGLISQSPNRLRTFDTHLFAPGREGIYRLASDQENWELQNVDIALPWSFFSFLDYTEFGDNQIVAINAEPWFSSDGGTTWEESTVNNSSFYQMNRVEIVGGKVFGWEESSSFPPHYVSENNGQTFQILTSLQEQHNTNIGELDKDNGTLYAQSFDNRLFRSADGGDHWAVIGTTIPTQLFGSPQWFGGGLFFVRGNSVFIFSNNYDSQFGTKVLFSDDLGQTWHLFDNLTTGFPWGEGIFNDLVESNGYLITATKAGVSYSSDAGTTWTAWNEGFENRVASRLCVHNGQLWASMTSDGVWKRSLSELAPLAVFQSDPTTALEVFPNPFRDRIFLKNTDKNVVAEMTNPFGQIVFSGKNIEQTDFSNLPTGIYFLKIQGDNGYKASGKVVLTR